MNPDYDLKQIDDFTFKCDISFKDSYIADEIEKWLLENFTEENDFQIDDSSYGTHAFTLKITFYNFEAITAFKLRWV